MQIGVLGAGQVGGSILLALRQRVPEVTAVAWDADEATRAHLRTAGIHVVEPAALVACDVLVLALPTPAARTWLADPPSGCTALVTDACSVKGALARVADGGLRYIGGHPMAGTEGAGWASARAEMFTGAPWALVLDDPAPAARDWLTVAGLLLGIGARVVPVTAAAHDAAVGIASHVPHVLTAAYGQALAEVGDDLALVLGASSFDDFTRLSASPGARTADLLWENRPAVLAHLAALRSSLGRIEATLLADDPGLFAASFTRAGEPRRRREAVRARLAEPPALLWAGSAEDCCGWLREQGQAAVVLAEIEPRRAVLGGDGPVTMHGWRIRP